MIIKQNNKFDLYFRGNQGLPEVSDYGKSKLPINYMYWILQSVAQELILQNIDSCFDFEGLPEAVVRMKILNNILFADTCIYFNSDDGWMVNDENTYLYALRLGEDDRVILTVIKYTEDEFEQEQLDFKDYLIY